MFLVYRSITTTLITVVTVAIQVAAAPGVVAVLSHLGIIPLSTYATNLLTLLTVAAATDYAIFRWAATRRRGRRAWIARRRTSSCTAKAPRT